MARMKKTLFPVTHKFIIKKPGGGFDLDDYHGEILECYNCFLPDHYYSRVTRGGNVLYEGGVRYGDPGIYDSSLPYWQTQRFEFSIAFAFTPLPNYMSWHAPVRIANVTQGPDHLFAPWNEQEVVRIDTQFWEEMAPVWEQNAISAVTTRGGTHGFTVTADDWQPYYDGEPRNGKFLSYLGLNDWYVYPNEHTWFLNSHAKQVLSFSENKTITPAGNMKTRAESPFYWYDFGPDMAADYSSYECDFGGLPVYERNSLDRDFCFWVYDYSHFLGVNLRNIEGMVEQGAVNGTFPQGFIPHEDARGATQGKNWAYRWISNDYKYAPWERYPLL